MISLNIILTATIEPQINGGKFTSKERFKMYSDTLEYYSKVIGKKYPIFLFENSSADLSDWIKFKDKLNLTVIQFNPSKSENNDFDNNKGKGYNEFLMIKKGIQEISISNNKYERIYFLKITGRYALLNILDIIKEIEKNIMKHNYLFMGDIKDTCIYKLIGRDTLSSHWGDSRFFCAELNFYKNHMKECYKEMDDYLEGSWAEDYFLRFSRTNRKDKSFKFRFKTQVRFNGISGTLNSEDINNPAKQADSKKNKIKADIRQILRYLFPNVWF